MALYHQQHFRPYHGQLQLLPCRCQLVLPSCFLPKSPNYILKCCGSRTSLLVSMAEPDPGNVMCRLQESAAACLTTSPLPLSEQSFHAVSIML